MRSELIFNGQPFSAFDAYVATSNFLDGAAKDYTSVSVLGRSGDLQISNNRYKNITVKVRVYVRSNMEQNIRAMRSYLESVNGYARLELSDQPNEYRIGLFKDMFAPKPYDRNVGAVELTFDCKPQRFLKVGEIPVSASSQSVSYEGNPAEIDNPSGLSAVDSLSVALNPSQDFNGYDAPWVGGTGKNILNVTNFTVGQSKTSGGVTCTYNEDGSFTLNGTSTASNVFWNLNYVKYSHNIQTDVSLKMVIETISDGVRLQVSATSGIKGGVYAANSPVTVTLSSDEETTWARLQVPTSGTALDNVKVYPMIMLDTETDTTYEPYENVCPISGTEEVTVTQTGKNLLDPSPWSAYLQNDGTYRLSANTAFNIHVPIPSFLIGKEITFSAYINSQGDAPSNERVGAVINGTAINGTFIASGTKGYSTVTFTPVSADDYLTFGYASGAAKYFTFSEPQLEFGNERTKYEPYTSASYPYSLGQTVYGGTVDLATGVLTVTTVSKTIASYNNWTDRISNQNRVYTDVANLFGDDTPYVYASEAEMTAEGLNLCDKMPVKNTGSNRESPSVTVGLYNYVYINGVTHINGVTDEATLNTWLDNNPLQVTYRLATPTTVQLTAQQISLLTGINYISSGDEVTVTVSEPSLLENPTLFESKPLIRVYGNGLLAVNNQYITVASNPFPYIDIDCDMMDAFYGANNANQYVSLPNDYITLHSGNNYIAYDGTVEITPRWYEV